MRWHIYRKVCSLKILAQLPPMEKKKILTHGKRIAKYDLLMRIASELKPIIIMYIKCVHFK